METFPPFERNTRVPNPLPPRGSCDGQIHVFADQAKYPIRSGSAYQPPQGSFEDAKRVHRTLGIDRCMVVQATSYGTDHRLLLDVLAGEKNYKGIAIIDDSVSDKELLRLHEAGIRGARFNFAKFLDYVPSVDGFRRSIARIQELGWYAKIHAMGEELLEYEDLFRTLTLPVVLDHLGHVDFSLGLRQPACNFILDMLRNHGWWIMISNGDRWSQKGPPWEDAIPYMQAFAEAAPDRTIWGTDWPHVKYRRAMANDADLIELLYRAVPDIEFRRKILVDNPARLFGFEARGSAEGENISLESTRL